MQKTSMLTTSALTTSLLKTSTLTPLALQEGEAERNAERGSGRLFLIGRAAGQRETADWLEWALWAGLGGCGYLLKEGNSLLST